MKSSHEFPARVRIFFGIGVGAGAYCIKRMVA